MRQQSSPIAIWKRVLRACLQPLIECLPVLFLLPAPPRRSQMAASPREDPSRLTKEELSTRGAETVAAVGAIARLVAKQSVSAPLQSTISTFADYEKTIVSTEEMLRKTMKGMSDMSDALDEISASMQG